MCGLRRRAENKRENICTLYEFPVECSMLNNFVVGAAERWPSRPLQPPFAPPHPGSAGRLAEDSFGWCRNLTALDLSNNPDLQVSHSSCGPCHPRLYFFST